MLTFIVKRVMGLVPVLLIAVILTFLANQAVPGDPIAALLSDRSGDAALEARLRAAYGLDRPLLEQFISYIGNILSGDFGLSFRFAQMPVSQLIGEGLLITPLMALAALAIAFPLGVLLGTLAAIRQNSWVDTGIILVLVAGISIPNFAMATGLVYFFALQLRWLPVAGWGSVEQAIMPLTLLIIPTAAYIARLSRTYMLEVLRTDYIRTARAKGVPERVMLLRHALRNTMVPLLTTVGIILGGLLSGTFVVETIFNIPGLGSLAIQAIFARDYPVTMAIVLLFTAFYAGINLLVDLSYGLLDPRIRVGGGGR